MEIADIWEARCIGNREAILDLLKHVAYIGKLRSIGFGEIDEWQIEEGDFDTAIVMDGKLAHAVPVGCGITCESSPVLVGWTPPQWKTSLHSLGWMVGERV